MSTYLSIGSGALARGSGNLCPVPKAPLTAAVDDIARAVLVEEMKSRGFRKKSWRWTYNYMSEAIAEPAIVIDLSRRAHSATFGRFTLSLWSGWAGSLAAQDEGYEVLSATLLPGLATGTDIYDYVVDLASDPRSPETRLEEFQRDWSEFGAPWLDAVSEGPDELLAYYRSLSYYDWDTKNLAVAVRVDLVEFFDEWIQTRIDALEVAPPEGWHACLRSALDAVEWADEHGVTLTTAEALAAAVHGLLTRMQSVTAAPSLKIKRIEEEGHEFSEGVDLRSSLPPLAARLGIDLGDTDPYVRPGHGLLSWLDRDELQLRAAPWRAPGNVNA
jgi:hypothetical protein